MARLAIVQENHRSPRHPNVFAQWRASGEHWHTEHGDSVYVAPDHHALYMSWEIGRVTVPQPRAQ
jgi:hypothetical protein